MDAHAIFLWNEYVYPLEEFIDLIERQRTPLLLLIHSIPPELAKTDSEIGMFLTQPFIEIARKISESPIFELIDDVYQGEWRIGSIAIGTEKGVVSYESYPEVYEVRDGDFAPQESVNAAWDFLEGVNAVESFFSENMRFFKVLNDCLPYFESVSKEVEMTFGEAKEFEGFITSDIGGYVVQLKRGLQDLKKAIQDMPPYREEWAKYP